jgi:basic membrane lipoprotein Med (substrate-binding protein (PBP1-ABC) superfamily)
LVSGRQAPKEGYVPSLALLARQRYDLVFGIGVVAAPAMDRVATVFPETRFAIIDAGHEELAARPKNVLGLSFSAEQAGYLAGHLAARVLTLSPGPELVSAVGGERVPGVERWIAGYQAGARGANPGVTTLHGYTDDFLDPVKARSVALCQIAKGSRKADLRARWVVRLERAENSKLHPPSGLSLAALTGPLLAGSAPVRKARQAPGRKRAEANR